MKHYDAVIVGGGLVGLATAIALQQVGFSVVVIDAKAPVLDWDSESIDLRVSAISRASKQLLMQLNVWQHYDSLHMGQYESMQVWDANSSGMIRFDAADVGLQALGYIGENRRLVKAMWQECQDLAAIELICPSTIQTFEHDGDVWQVSLSTEERLSTPLLIGADGSRSWLRQQVGIETQQQHHHGQYAVVCVVETEKSHCDIAYQRFLSTGPLAFLPLYDRHQCSIVWSTTDEASADLVQCDAADFNRRCQAALSAELGTIRVIGQRARFPLMRQHAKTYVQSGLALVGDAAHSIHPLAGQGVNLGFLDVAALAKTLGQAKAKGRPYAHLACLQRYERERRLHNAAMLSAMEGFNQVFGATQPHYQRLRGNVLSWTDRQQWLKRFFIRQAAGVS